MALLILSPSGGTGLPEGSREHRYEITLKLFKGSVTPVARTSPYALYDETLASFGESGGTFSQTASPGFIELFSLQSRMASRIRTRDAKETK